MAEGGRGENVESVTRSGREEICGRGRGLEVSCKERSREGRNDVAAVRDDR